MSVLRDARRSRASSGVDRHLGGGREGALLRRGERRRNSIKWRLAVSESKLAGRDGGGSSPSRRRCLRRSCSSADVGLACASGHEVLHDDGVAVKFGAVELIGRKLGVLLVLMVKKLEGLVGINKCGLHSRRR